jgi:hypothetical protein
MSRQAVSTAGEFKLQTISNLMWAYAKLGIDPGAELAGAMSRQAVSTAGEFKPQSVANLMWAYATLGIDPGTQLAGAMSRQATSTTLLEEFKPQSVVNLMWAYETLGIDPIDQLLFNVSSYSSLSIAHMSQLHQCFLCMELEGLLLGALSRHPQYSALRGRCRAAFEGGTLKSSGFEREVARRLLAMGAQVCDDTAGPAP